MVHARVNEHFFLSQSRVNVDDANKKDFRPFKTVFTVAKNKLGTYIDLHSHKLSVEITDIGMN